MKILKGELSSPFFYATTFWFTIVKLQDKSYIIRDNDNLLHIWKQHS
jgi:hypothetical protein